jgi:hypothetical protein
VHLIMSVGTVVLGLVLVLQTSPEMQVLGWIFVGLGLLGPALRFVLPASATRRRG